VLIVSNDTDVYFAVVVLLYYAVMVLLYYAVINSIQFMVQ